MTDSEKLDLLLVKMTQMDGKFDNLDKEVKGLGEKVDSLDAKVSSLDKEVRGLNARVDSLDAKVDSLDKEVRGLNARVDSLDAKVSNLDAKVNSLDAKVGSLDTRVSGLEEEVKGLHIKADKLDEDVTEIRLTLENEISVNIRRVAEGHLDLSRNMHEMRAFDSEKEMLVLRVNMLDTEVRRIKAKLGIVAW